MRLVKTCFLIDGTASMGPYIQSTKRQVRNIMESLKQAIPYSTFLFGAVIYRDFGDIDQYEVYPFQEDITESIRNVEPYGGGDIPEDVAGGYQRLLEMDWDDAGVKFVFHIADAPPHGLIWHSPNMQDLIPHPEGPFLEESIVQLSMKNIHLSIVRINNSTNEMIEIFATICGDNFNVIDLDENLVEEPELLDDTLSENIIEHISQTLSLTD
jgi:hypothetical protein